MTKALGYQEKVDLVCRCFEENGWDCPVWAMKQWLTEHGCKLASKGYLLHLRALARSRYKPNWRRTTGAPMTYVRYEHGKTIKGKKTHGQWVRECFETLGWRCSVWDMGEWLAMYGVSMSKRSLLAMRRHVRGSRRARLAVSRARRSKG